MRIQNKAGEWSLDGSTIKNIQNSKDVQAYSQHLSTMESQPDSSEKDAYGRLSQRAKCEVCKGHNLGIIRTSIAEITGQLEFYLRELIHKDGKLAVAKQVCKEANRENAKLKKRIRELEQELDKEREEAKKAREDDKLNKQQKSNLNEFDKDWSNFKNSIKETLKAK